MNEKNRLPSSADGLASKQKERIGQQLRQLYDDVANEPVPDDFLKLLEEADDAAEEQDEDDTE